NPRRADLERAPIGHATGIDLQSALDHAWLKLWVLGDDVFAGTDFERPTQFVRSEEAKRIKRGEHVDALVHLKSHSQNTLKPTSYTKTLFLLVDGDNGLSSRAYLRSRPGALGPNESPHTPCLPLGP